MNLSVEDALQEQANALKYSDDMLISLVGQGVLPQSACMAGLMMACRAAIFAMPQHERNQHLLLLAEGLVIAYDEVKASL